jgi:hypothetical protein
MLYDNTIIYIKSKTTYKEHRKKMFELSTLYNNSKISYVEALIMFLDHLEVTTGIRPYNKAFPYKKDKLELSFKATA